MPTNEGNRGTVRRTGPQGHGRERHTGSIGPAATAKRFITRYDSSSFHPPNPVQTPCKHLANTLQKYEKNL